METIKNSEYHFCRDLPTIPQPEMGRILVTGATGYIGGRLVPELIERGYQVRIMVRVLSPVHQERWPDAEIVVADVLDIVSLKNAFKEIHTAYYLIHSLLLGKKHFESADVQGAINFRNAAEEMGVQRIIYLGGLGDLRSTLSPHLRSRIEVGRELGKGKVPTTILRAAIILGSGSASYEILINTAKKMPIIPIPYWMKAQCQPIAIRDVIKYLVGALECFETTGKSFDIGGMDVLTYDEMLQILAKMFGKKTMSLPSFFSGLRFFAILANLFAPVPWPIILALLEGLRNNVVCQDNAIMKLIPFEPLTYKESIIRAMSREEQDNVHTRWSDAYPPAHSLAIKLNELKISPKFIKTYSLVNTTNAADIFSAVCRIGGKEGWFQNNWMWRLRGMADSMLGGVGMARGRRSSSELRVNDVIDFWRVEDMKPSRKLLLRAEMKLPGKAWLEFDIDQSEHSNQLSITAYFIPHGILGNIYWYMFLPFHGIIFKDLLKQIVMKG
ncbi:MAG: SDR family oxidoreductase [Pseudomonadota bacterium]